MKKLLFSLSLLATLATFAGESTIEATAQVFGCLPVTTSNQTVIVSVPWVTPGYDNADIAVSNIIKTANLTVGDTIRVYNRDKGAFNVWTLAENEGVKYWSGVTVVGTNSAPVITGPADITTLARGGALILTRNADSSEEGKWVAGQNYTFYVYGQLSTSSAQITVPLAIGTTNVSAYTLIAPPYADDTDLNDDAAWGGLVSKKGASGDLLLVCDGKSSAYKTFYLRPTSTDADRRWGTLRQSWVDVGEIKAGVGCWFVSKGANPDITLTWKASK